MSPARPACAPQLFSLPAGSTDPEFARVLRTGDPGPALDGPLTFLPPVGASAKDWLRFWHQWRQESLTVTLAPILLQTAALAGQGRAREILPLDQEVTAAFDSPTGERSAAAGKSLLARLASSRGERWLARLHQWAAAGQTPAHFPVVYAGQHALFHLPLRLLVPAYAYWEWTAAMSARPCVGESTPDFAGETAELSQLAQNLLSGPSSPYAADHLPAAASDR